MNSQQGFWAIVTEAIQILKSIFYLLEVLINIELKSFLNKERIYK